MTNTAAAAVDAARAAWKAARLIDDRLGSSDPNRMLMWAGMFAEAGLTNPTHAKRAVVDWYKPGRDRVIQPGDVITTYRATASHPSARPAAEVIGELGTAPPASAERRAELMAEIRKIADRKKIR